MPRASYAGQKEYKKYQETGKLTMGQAIKAKCYSCMASYADGRQDCGLKECPLYIWQPFRKKG